MFTLNRVKTASWVLTAMLTNVKLPLYQLPSVSNVAVHSVLYRLHGWLTEFGGNDVVSTRRGCPLCQRKAVVRPWSGELLFMMLFELVIALISMVGGVRGRQRHWLYGQVCRSSLPLTESPQIMSHHQTHVGTTWRACCDGQVMLDLARLPATTIHSNNRYITTGRHLHRLTGDSFRRNLKHELFSSANDDHFQ